MIVILFLSVFAFFFFIHYFCFPAQLVGSVTLNGASGQTVVIIPTFNYLPYTMSEAQASTDSGCKALVRVSTEVAGGGARRSMLARLGDPSPKANILPGGGLCQGRKVQVGAFEEGKWGIYWFRVIEERLLLTQRTAVILEDVSSRDGACTIHFQRGN